MKKKLFIQKILMWGAICALTVGMGEARADLYRVPDVPVVAELSSALEAREVALANGQVDAFWHLMRKMTAPTELTKVPVLSQHEVINLVQNVSISDEKTTATRYMATLLVRFNPQKIQALLTENKIPFLIQEPPVYLLVPVFQQSDQVFFLEEKNPVFSALKKNISDSGLFTFVLPEGTEDENQSMRELWKSQSENGWYNILQKYKADRVLLVEVVKTGPNISFETRAVPTNKESLELMKTQTVVPDGNVAKIFPQLWKKRLADLERVWRATKTNDLSSPNIFWFHITIENLKEWHGIEQDLKKASFLTGMDIQAFKPRQVLVSLKYKGSEEQLRQDLAQIGFAIRQDPEQTTKQLMRGLNQDEFMDESDIVSPEQQRTVSVRRGEI